MEIVWPGGTGCTFDADSSIVMDSDDKTAYTLISFNDLTAQSLFFATVDMENTTISKGKVFKASVVSQKVHSLFFRDQKVYGFFQATNDNVFFEYTPASETFSSTIYRATISYNRAFVSPDSK